MSILSRKYPFQPSSSWMVESLRNCAVVFLILYFLQPFGFSAYEGNKLLASFLFGAVTFLCCLAFRFLVFIPLQKHVRPWRIWHEALTVLMMVLFIGICNFFLAVRLFQFPLSWELFLMFLYWALVVGVIVGGVSTAVSYSRHLRGQLDTEMQTTLAAVLADLEAYPNIFQCHRSFAVNVNNISAARGNSNGYTLELGGGVAAVPVSRSYVPKLKSYIS